MEESWRNTVQFYGPETGPTTYTYD
jgi:hypothetical protein